MTDVYKLRDEVVAQVRASLPEFCKRNGILVVQTKMKPPTLTDGILNNLAHWAVGAIPPRVYQVGCPTDAPCACSGFCTEWKPVSFSFTWEDVDRLRRNAYNAPEGYSGNPWMEDLADRMAALLPPRHNP